MIAIEVPVGCLQPTGLALGFLALDPACCSAASKKRTFQNCQNRRFQLCANRVRVGLSEQSGGVLKRGSPGYICGLPGAAAGPQ